MPIDKWDDRKLVMLAIGEGRGRRYYRMWRDGIDVFLYGWIWQWLHSTDDEERERGSEIQVVERFSIEIQFSIIIDVSRDQSSNTDQRYIRIDN